MKNSKRQIKSVYIAFLRGINSGKNPSTKMVDIIDVLTSIGFKNISSILASGNFIFESNDKKIDDLEDKIDNAFEKKFSFNPKTTIRTAEEIKELCDNNPFKNIELHKNEKAYVSFLGREVSQNIEPMKSEGFSILGVENKVVISTVNLENASSPDLRQFLDKNFGKEVTTRGWPTIEKIYKKLI